MHINPIEKAMRPLDSSQKPKRISSWVPKYPIYVHVFFTHRHTENQIEFIRAYKRIKEGIDV